MRILVFLPIDAIVKSWARRFEADGHEVLSTHTFRVFREHVRRADWTLVNASKDDSPRYVWKILLSILYARLFRRRIALFLSIDLVDLCDRPLVRAFLTCINWVAYRWASVVILLAQREHIARRYRLPKERLLLVYNCPDRATFAPRPRPPRERDRPLTFLYHGELLWWHGLERFLPLYEEIRKHRPARLIVTGNFYPSVFRVFGLAASRREVAVKRQLKALLEREDVDYRGRVEIDVLRRLMAEAEFHVTQLNDEDVMGRTELRTCLLEAMAAGMACLHAPTPGLPRDLFRDGENIVLLDPANPAAAAAKILELADSPERLDAIRRHAVRTIEEHFDMDAAYQKALKHLEQSHGADR